MATPEQNEWRVPLDAQSAAFRAGYRAAQEDEPMEMCPYTSNHYAIQWQQGWHAAIEDRGGEEVDHANP